MLASLTGLQTFFVVLYVLIGLLLIGVILLQKGRGGGLGSAFGGGGGPSPFGAKTGDVFTWITVVLAGLAILIGVVGNYVLVPQKATVASPRVSAPGVPTDQTGVSPTPTGPTQQPVTGESPGAGSQAPAEPSGPGSGPTPPSTGASQPQPPAGSEEPTS